MLKELMLLVDGEGESTHKVKDDARGSQEDLRCELTDNAKRDAQRMGVWISQNQLLPDLVLTSPEARTMAAKLCKSAGLCASMVEIEPGLQQCSAVDMLDVAKRIRPDCRRALMVGHDQSVHEFARRFSRRPDGGQEHVSSVPPGTLLVLGQFDRDLNLSAPCCELLDVISPGDLPRDFPYPGKDGSERRPRPSYYYRQSAVIPFRRGQQGLEVLLISTQKRKRWLVPKGIHDPGMSAQESAANEALEEAGVTGKVSDASIGVFEIGKWGGTCTVTVYPMLVTKELPDSEWEENYRGRQWLAVREAAKVVEIDELKHLIRRLPEVVANPDED